MGEVATDRRDGRPAAPLRKNSASHSLPVGGPRYEFLHRLTVGGMAELHLARMHGIEGFQKHVVVKQLLPHCCGDPEFVSLFLDEARLAGQLDHQNIGQVHDVGQIDGRYFFAMEYLHGKDLRSLLERAHSGGDRIPLEHALTIVSHVAAALHYAHEKCDDDGEPLRIVHRDVSPANIIVTYDGGVKLVDFGIARATTRPSTTRTGTIRGKIFYMSPEQCLSKPIDARSDLFSLGIVMYELVTTSWLFRSSKSQSDYTIMSRIVRGDIPPPSAVVDDVPPALEDIILRALAIKPDDRHASAQELILEIEAMASTACIPLSTTALSQYLVDLFGRTPEPWRTIETLARQTGSEVDSATEPDDPSTGPDDADEPGDDTGEPGDDADEPGDDADEPGDDADEPGDDAVIHADRTDDDSNQLVSSCTDSSHAGVAQAGPGGGLHSDGDSDWARPEPTEPNLGREAAESSELSAPGAVAIPTVEPGQPDAASVPVAIEDGRTSRMLALPLPAARPPTRAATERHRSGDAVPRAVTVEQTLPRPPPPVEEDLVTVEVVAPQPSRIWIIGLAVLATITAVMVVAALV